MADSLFLSFTTVLCVFITVQFQESDALKCWTCNSNGTNSKFCEDPFDSSVISDHTRHNSYMECGTPQGQKNPYSRASVQKAVCMKLVQVANGKKEYLRKCNFENVDAPKDDCISTKTPKNVENYFCETCNTDGCNSASQYGPIAALIILSAINLGSIAYLV